MYERLAFVASRVSPLTAFLDSTIAPVRESALEDRASYLRSPRWQRGARVGIHVLVPSLLLFLLDPLQGKWLCRAIA